MALSEKILNFLGENKVPYKLLEHDPVFTSQEAANVRKDINLHQGAKAMVVKVTGSGLLVNRQDGFTDTKNKELATNNYFVMCVLPGDKKIDFKKLKKLLNSPDATLSSPQDVERIIGVKIGAVSPFGNLSGLTVYLDDSIMDNQSIAFNIGLHEKSVIMGLQDYIKIVNPVVVSFSKII